MQGAIGAIFVFYMLVSVIAGIVSAVRKSQTTTRSPRPVYSPGQPAQPVAEFDLEEATDDGVQEVSELSRPSVATSELVSRIEEGLGHTGLETSHAEGTSSEWPDDLTKDISEGATDLALPSTASGSSTAASKWSSRGLMPSAKYLAAHRDQLRAMVIAMEVLGKPKGLGM